LSARETIRGIIDEQLALLAGLSSRGALPQDELDRLETLTKTARLADGLVVPKAADGTEDLSDAELEARVNGR